MLMQCVCVPGAVDRRGRQELHVAGQRVDGAHRQDVAQAAPARRARLHVHLQLESGPRARLGPGTPLPLRSVSLLCFFALFFNDPRSKSEH